MEYWQNQYEESVKSYRALEEAKNSVIEDMTDKFYEFLADLNGVSSHHYKQTTEAGKSTGVWKRRLKKFCDTLYILMCTSFAVSVLFISCSFIKTDLKANYSSTPTNQKTIIPPKQIPPAQPDKSD